jgi:hypothetical protein
MSGELQKQLNTIFKSNPTLGVENVNFKQNKGKKGITSIDMTLTTTDNKSIKNLFRHAKNKSVEINSIDELIDHINAKQTTKKSTSENTNNIMALKELLLPYNNIFKQEFKNVILPPSMHLWKNANMVDFIVKKIDVNKIEGLRDDEKERLKEYQDKYKNFVGKTIDEIVQIEPIKEEKEEKEEPVEEVKREEPNEPREQIGNTQIVSQNIETSGNMMYIYLSLLNMISNIDKDVKIGVNLSRIKERLGSDENTQDVIKKEINNVINETINRFERKTTNVKMIDNKNFNKKLKSVKFK